MLDEPETPGLLFSAAPTAATPPKAQTPPPAAGGLVFQPPPAELAPARPKPVRSEPTQTEPTASEPEKSASRRAEPTRSDSNDDEPNKVHDSSDDSDSNEDGPKRRRRSRGGRRRRRGDDDSDASNDEANEEDSSAESSADGESAGDDATEDSDDDNGTTTRRRRRRARAGEGAEVSPDDPENTVVKVREGRQASGEITGLEGSTRLEAKKQRRREGREASRRRAPIITEAEFLSRRESVNRQMVVRQHDDYTQIAVLEDKVLVEHYVARESQTSLIGNVYLGKVQNVLPSMEAAFVDIGEGRNAVIYAGEVDWSDHSGNKQRKIEDALSPGQSVLVQVTKDPVGQKGARLTSQISLPGRFLVYVPGGGSQGISRKLPDTERARLKALLKEVLPADVGVIVRTAAEGATEDQISRDVTALAARWEDIEAKSSEGKAPQLLYSEPDLMIKVIRDLFNEDFAELIVDGAQAWDMVSGYISHVAPDMIDRLTRWEDENDAFSSFRIDDQIHKALERKVHLPSGGSLVIDRTEAMTVVDVNTGRFTGSGGNLEETVTKNNLEAAEEIVRQLRLRDIGGIIVIDFIDMVLESNRDLVLRRLVECLGRDRTRHQVAEVTSLGLVQMTRKRIGTGLLESFSNDCVHCKGRGVVIADAPVEPKKDDGQRRGRRGGQNNNRKRGQSGNQNSNQANNGNGQQNSDKNNQAAQDQPTAEPSVDNDDASQRDGQTPVDQPDTASVAISADQAQDTAAEQVPAQSEANGDAASNQGSGRSRRSRGSRGRNSRQQNNQPNANEADQPASESEAPQLPLDIDSAEQTEQAPAPRKRASRSRRTSAADSNSQNSETASSPENQGSLVSDAGLDSPQTDPVLTDDGSRP